MAGCWVLGAVNQRTIHMRDTERGNRSIDRMQITKHAPSVYEWWMVGWWMWWIHGVASASPHFHRPLPAFNPIIYLFIIIVAVPKNLFIHIIEFCVCRILPFKINLFFGEFVIPWRSPPFPLKPEQECARSSISKQSSALNNKQCTMHGITISSAIIFYPCQQ